MTFASIRCQERAKGILGSFLAKKRIPSAMVFHGPDGVGKTMTAVAFAQALLCADAPMDPAGGCGLCEACAAIGRRLHLDVKILDAAYQAGIREEEVSRQKTLRVETLRHLRKDMELGSMMGSWKVAIIPQAHHMEAAGANTILKCIEEPPPRTLWILATFQRDRLPKTILSRTFPVPFAPLPPEEIQDILERRGVLPETAAALSEFCEGSASRAIELAEAGLPAPEGDPFADHALPRESVRARARVELSLFALERSLLARLRRRELSCGRAVGAMRRLGALRRALRANVDPGSILAMAHLEVEKA